MSTLFYSFFIPFLAGISTILGYFPTYISKKHQDSVIAISLAISSGVMLTVSCFSLFPEAISTISSTLTVSSLLLFLAWFALGVLCSLFLDYEIAKLENFSPLYRLGLVSSFALILHNIPEGITTFLTTSSNFKLGLSLSIAIALHNIPEGIAIAVPIYYSTGSHKKAFFYTFLSGFSEFFGAILAYLFLYQYFQSTLLFIVLSATCGIMVHISIQELLPKALSYGSLKKVLFGFLLGCFLMFLCIFYFNI